MTTEQAIRDEIQAHQQALREAYRCRVAMYRRCGRGLHAICSECIGCPGYALIRRGAWR